MFANSKHKKVPEFEKYFCHLYKVIENTLIIPSLLFLLSVTTLLFFTFLFTTTSLSSLLLFGYWQVFIGVIVDKFIKLSSLLRTLKSKQDYDQFFPG